MQKITSLTLVTTTLFGLGCTEQDQNINNKKPNIIVILADDLGWGDLSCYGADSIHTPNIDHLSEEGVSFTNFYANASVSTPTRAGLLTGRYQVRSNMTHIEAPWVNKGIPESELTLAKLLKTKDYVTHLIGKWHPGHKDGHRPMDNGFDHF